MCYWEDPEVQKQDQKHLVWSTVQLFACQAPSQEIWQKVFTIETTAQSGKGSTFTSPSNPQNRIRTKKRPYAYFTAHVNKCKCYACQVEIRKASSSELFKISKICQISFPGVTLSFHRRGRNANAAVFCGQRCAACRVCCSLRKDRLESLLLRLLGFSFLSDSGTRTWPAKEFIDSGSFQHVLTTPSNGNQRKTRFGSVDPTVDPHQCEGSRLVFRVGITGILKQIQKVFCICSEA